MHCHLKDIVLERDNGFRVAVPDLEIATQGHDAVCKLPLMGESGAGKSTLLNIMAAIEWPHRGHVRWTFPDGKRIQWSRTGPPAGKVCRLRRQYFGYAFQNSTLIPHLCVLDNLCYPLRFLGCPAARSRTIAQQALGKVLLKSEKCHLDELCQRFPSTLSGGQQQRVALVQALIHQPFVLFADEPTGSLDPSTRQQVMDVLLGWVDNPRHSGNRLLVWVTHHEDDPARAQVLKYLRVAAGHCGWSRTNRSEPADSKNSGFQS